MKKIALFGILLLLILLALPAGAAYAAPNVDRIIHEGETVHEDIVVFGDRLVVEEGATVDGDVSIFGGSAQLAGTIEGDVAIFGGTTTLTGEITGELVIFGGSMSASGTADIGGECILVGGTMSGDRATQLGCTEVGDFGLFAIPSLARPAIPAMPEAPGIPAQPRMPAPPISRGSGFLGTISSIAAWSLVTGLMALVVGYLAPNQLGRVSRTLKGKPAASGMVGFLTLIAVPSLMVLLAIISAILSFVCIGLLGWPILLVLMVAFGLGMLLAWVAVGNIFGRRLAVWLKLSNRSLPIVAALGTATLTLVSGLLGALPWFLGGWLWSIAAFLIFCAGLGAVALTRFGTRPYPFALATGDDDKIIAILDTLPDRETTAPNEKPPVE